MALPIDYRGPLRRDPVPASTDWTTAVKYYAPNDPVKQADLIKRIEENEDLVMNDLYRFDPLRGHYPFMHPALNESINLIKPIWAGYPVPEGHDPKYVFRAKDHLLFIEAMNIYGEDFWLISHHMGLGPTGQGLVAMYARKMHNLVGIQIIGDHIIEARKMGYPESVVRMIVARLYDWAGTPKFVEKLLPVAKAALEIERNGGVIPDHLKLSDDEEEEEKEPSRKRKRGKGKKKKKKKKKKKGKGKGRGRRGGQPASTGKDAAESGEMENGDGHEEDASDDKAASAVVVDNPLAGKKYSKYQGVSWNKGSGKWQATITTKGKPKNLGHFDDEVEAAKAYDKAARAKEGNKAFWNFDTNDNEIDHEANLLAQGPDRTTSIFKGVIRGKNGLWIPKIYYKGKTKKLHPGLADEEAAAKIYDHHARRLHGAKAEPNFDLAGNRIPWKKKFARATQASAGRCYKPSAAAASSSSNSAAATSSSTSTSADATTAMASSASQHNDDDEWEDMKDQRNEEESEWEDIEG